jgi:hypothetical protein
MLQQLIKKYPNKPWDGYQLSKNSNITREFIMSQNIKIIKPKYLIKFTMRDFDEITMDIIESQPNKQWDWLVISYNPHITMEIIISNPDKPWDWSAVSCNPNVTMDFIEANSDKEWDWGNISYNPNRTLGFIERYIDKIQWYDLSMNEFEHKFEEYRKYKCYKNFPYIKRRTAMIYEVLQKFLNNDCISVITDMI